MDELSFQWLFSRNWSEPWPLYRDIFLYARDHRIPVVGLNYDKGLMHRISLAGIASLSDREAAQLPGDVSCARRSSYTAFLAAIYRRHPGRTGSFDNFCVAQTVWNKGMGRRLADYRRRHPEKTVVALVGSFHAVKGAIPAAAGNLGFLVLVPAGVGIDTNGPRNADFVFE